MKNHDWVVWHGKDLKNTKKELQRNNVKFGNDRERQSFKVRLIIEASNNNRLWEIL